MVAATIPNKPSKLARRRAYQDNERVRPIVDAGKFTQQRNIVKQCSRSIDVVACPGRRAILLSTIVKSGFSHASCSNSPQAPAGCDELQNWRGDLQKRGPRLAAVHWRGEYGSLCPRCGQFKLPSCCSESGDIERRLDGVQILSR